ncbi:MAG: ABC transporter ATP-binding protein [Hyphomicrobiaceae bacterium]|nr:ABC transporter ATP-binding protein [Hyphomicrobiaceae bacterium]
MAESRAASAPLLSTSALGRNFGGLAAVRDVSICLHQGELHAVIGPNGAGKSTLVNLLSGHLAPTAGLIQLDGRDISGEPAWRMTRLGIGRSFQRTNVMSSLSVLENVRLAAQAVAGLRLSRLFTPAARENVLVEAARHCLERVGLMGVEDRPCGLLSHGEQRQLEIAMTLAARPRVLLLDEPLAGMGPEEGERFMHLLKDLAREHAILLIEHDMDFVFAVADWMTVMVDGTVLAEGRPPAVRANAEVQRAYLGGHA